MGRCALGALRPGPAVRLSLLSLAFVPGWTTPTSAMRDVLITRRPFAASFTINFSNLIAGWMARSKKWLPLAKPPPHKATLIFAASQP